MNLKLKSLVDVSDDVPRDPLPPLPVDRVFKEREDPNAQSLHPVITPDLKQSKPEEDSKRKHKKTDDRKTEDRIAIVENLFKELYGVNVGESSR